MTHRGRLIAIVTVTLVIAACCLNCLLGGAGQSGSTAAQTTGPPPQGLPMYVPPPPGPSSSAEYGQWQPAVNAGTALVTAYLTFDTTKQSKAQYLASMPKVSPTMTATLVAMAGLQWDGATATQEVSKVANVTTRNVTPVGGKEVTIAFDVAQLVWDKGVSSPDRARRASIDLDVSTGQWMPTTLQVV